MELDAVSAEFTKKLEEVAKGITDKMTSVEEKVDLVHKKSTELESRIGNLKTGKEEKDEEENILDELDDDNPIKMKESVKNELRVEFQQEASYQRECASWDNLAFQKFVLLKDKTSAFSKEVEKELEKVFPIAMKDGKKILPPDAIYNSAARVAADWALQGKLPIQIHEELEGGGNFNRKIKGKELGEVEKDIIDFYKTYGINEARAIQRIKDQNARG